MSQNREATWHAGDRCERPECTCHHLPPVETCTWWGAEDLFTFRSYDKDTWDAKWCPRCGYERADHTALWVTP